MIQTHKQRKNIIIFQFPIAIFVCHEFHIRRTIVRGKMFVEKLIYSDQRRPPLRARTK